MLHETKTQFAATQHQHSRTKLQLSIAQQVLSDLQEFATDDQKFKDEANALSKYRDQTLQALNFVRESLDQSFAAFDPSSDVFFSTVQAFSSVVSSLIVRH